MHQETSDALRISIMLILAAALISMVWYTVVIGNNVKVSSYEKGIEIAQDLSGSQLDSIKYIEDLVMPKAAVYNLISQEYKCVNSISYTGLDNKTTYVQFGSSKWEAKDAFGTVINEFNFPQDVLAEHLSGKSMIYVEPAKNNTFNIKITDMKNR